MSIKDKQQRRKDTQAAGDNRGPREPSPQLYPGPGPLCSVTLVEELAGSAVLAPELCGRQAWRGPGTSGGVISGSLITRAPLTQARGAPPPHLCEGQARHAVRTQSPPGWETAPHLCPCRPGRGAGAASAPREARPHPARPRGQAVPWPSVRHQLRGSFLSLALNLFLVFSQFAHVYSGSSVYRLCSTRQMFAERSF